MIITKLEYLDVLPFSLKSLLVWKKRIKIAFYKSRQQKGRPASTSLLQFRGGSSRSGTEGVPSSSMSAPNHHHQRCNTISISIESAFVLFLVFLSVFHVQEMRGRPRVSWSLHNTAPIMESPVMLASLLYFSVLSNLCPCPVVTWCSNCCSA